MRFQDLIGQQKAKQVFLQAVQENRLSHALLLQGAAGVGKLAFARAAAQYLNCENPTPADSCGQCGNCQKTQQGIHPDLHFVLPIISKVTAGKPATSDEFMEDFRRLTQENPYAGLTHWTGLLEAEKKQLFIPIHEMRSLKRKLALKAYQGQYKIAIVWHAEKVNVEAANAFLKLLEEPPEKTILILTAESSTQLLPTITSRCQRIQFERLKRPEIAQYLTQRYETQPALAADIAALADGSVANAMEMLNHAEEPFATRFIEWMRICYEGMMNKMQHWTEDISGQTLEYQKLYLEYSIKKLRDAFLFHENMPELALASENEKQFLQKFSVFASQPRAQSIYEQMENSLYYISRNANANMVFLVLCIKIHQLIKGQS